MFVPFVWTLGSGGVRHRSEPGAFLGNKLTWIGMKSKKLNVKSLAYQGELIPIPPGLDVKKHEDLSLASANLKIKAPNDILEVFKKPCVSEVAEIVELKNEEPVKVEAPMVKQ